MSAAKNIYRIAEGRPAVSFSEVAKALGVASQALDIRLRDTENLTAPNWWRAGGSRMLLTDVAADWLALHEREYDSYLKSSGQQWRLRA